MDYFRVLILIVLCVGRIHVADADMGTCAGGRTCAAGNIVCNDSDQCVCEDGFKEETDTCVKVLGGSCPVGTDCDSVPHSECITGTTVCKCATGYKEENNLCVASVLGGTCKANSDCDTVDNSECTTDTTVCKCATGYKEATNVCVASVLGGACGTDSVCAPDNTECNGSDKCVCQAGFIEGTGGKAKTCEKVLDGSCGDNADCINVPNSECTTDTCKCASGYEEKDNVCVASDPGSRGTRSLPCVLLMVSIAIFRFSFM